MTELDLFDNAITSLPTEIGTLRSLAELCVRDDQISELPTGLGAPPDHPGVVGDLEPAALCRALQRRRAGGAEAGVAASSCSKLLLLFSIAFGTLIYSSAFGSSAFGFGRSSASASAGAAPPRPMPSSAHRLGM